MPSARGSPSLRRQRQGKGQVGTEEEREHREAGRLHPWLLSPVPPGTRRHGHLSEVPISVPLGKCRRWGRWVPWWFRFHCLEGLRRCSLQRPHHRFPTTGLWGSASSPACAPCVSMATIPTAVRSRASFIRLSVPPMNGCIKRMHQTRTQRTITRPRKGKKSCRTQRRGRSLRTCSAKQGSHRRTSSEALTDARTVKQANSERRSVEEGVPGARAGERGSCQTWV